MSHKKMDTRLRLEKNYHKSAQLCPVCSAPDTPITIDLSACEAIEY